MSRQHAESSSAQAQAVERVQVPTDFSPSFWDPMYLRGVEFASTVLASMEAKVLEAFTALRRICGKPDFSAEDLDVAALGFGLVRYSLDGSHLPSERAAVFAQAVAATLYHRRARAEGPDPRAFYAFLVASSRATDAVFRNQRGKNKPLYILRGFLERYGLGGAEDLDLAFSLLRHLEPDLRRAAEFLSQAADGSGAERAPLPTPRPSPTVHASRVPSPPTALRELLP